MRKVLNLFIFLQKYLVPIIIIIFIAYKQLQPKEIDVDSKGKYVILIIGLFNAYNAITSKQLVLNAQTILGLIFTLIILAGGFAFWRAYTCKVWQKDNKYYRQGNYITLILWAVMIVLHAVVDHLITGLDSTFVLYLGTSFVVQHLVLLGKIKKSN